MLRGIIASSLFCGLLSAQAPPPAGAEVTSKDAPFTFRSGVDLVPVPVVVRDSRGHAIGNLGRDDFQLYDNGKPQMISKFSVEKLTNDAAASSGSPKEADGPAASGESPAVPDRFVAYLFDDLHMSPSDLLYTREAARRQIDSAAHAMERVAIYTTSGQPLQEFTSDREKLHGALAAIGTGRSAATRSTQQNSCPPMTYYMGDQITNRNDNTALGIATDDAMKCAHLDPPQRPLAVAMAKQAARETFLVGDRETLASLDTLRNVVSRMGTVPGQRTIVLISSGFLVLDDRHNEETAVIERAIRSNIVIGALDARGLPVSTMLGDASQPGVNAGTLSAKDSYARTESTIQSDGMATIAEGTGGIFYHGSNDYGEGMARTAAAPEYLYVLGFSPQDLKPDGKFHTLKVTLKDSKGMNLQVRKGYFAPRGATDPEEKSRQTILEAVFSRDEVRDLPASLRTQYFKTGDADATLAAIANIDVKKLPLRKEGGRNFDNLTVVTGLFDNDGNYISGVQKTVELRLLDETLEKRAGSGIAVKSSFAVHTGRYVVRLVVRDSEGQMMSEQSSPVEIP
jgi:VWFA-related protein